MMHGIYYIQCMLLLLLLLLLLFKLTQSLWASYTHLPIILTLVKCEETVLVC